MTERQLRYALSRAGYALHKSRARQWSVNNQLGFAIVDYRYNVCVGGPDFNFTLEDVEDFVRANCSRSPDK